MESGKYAFLFDVDDTLFDQLAPFRIIFVKNIKYFQSISIEDLYRYCLKYTERVLHENKDENVILMDNYIQRIFSAFEQYGIIISKDEAMNIQQDYLTSLKEIKLLPDVIDTFNYLKERNIDMGIITNGPSEHQRSKIKRLGLKKWINPDYYFISGEIGYAKPDIRIFKQAEKVMSLKPENTYFIGDSFANDVIGAKNAGWKSIWCNRRQNNISEIKIKPDHIISDKDLLLDAVKDICKDIQ